MKIYIHKYRENIHEVKWPYGLIFYQYDIDNEKKGKNSVKRITCIGNSEISVTKIFLSYLQNGKKIEIEGKVKDTEVYSLISIQKGEWVFEDTTTARH